MHGPISERREARDVGGDGADFFTSGGSAHPTRMAVQQDSADLALQTADMLTGRRVRLPQLPRGSGHGPRSQYSVQHQQRPGIKMHRHESNSYREPRLRSSAHIRQLSKMGVMNDETNATANQPQMQRIGLLGGMSWESTAPYYRLINQEVADRLGGLHSARLALASVDFAQIEQLQSFGRWDEAGRLLGQEAHLLEQGGADFVVLCTNTMHLVADAIQDAITIPLLNLIDVVADAIRHDGIHTVGLLGTQFTMEHDFYRDRLKRHGITTLVPTASERADVHRIIYDELCLGHIRDESRTTYEHVIKGLVSRGAQGVILGCTEIELLLTTSHHDGVPLYPTTQLHAHAAVDQALASR